MADGKRLIRHDVIFELYQNQPTIFNDDPANRDPSDSNQDSNYTNEDYLEQLDEHFVEPIRDPFSIFSKSALQSLPASESPGSSTLQQSFPVSESPGSSTLQNKTSTVPESSQRPKRSNKQTEMYVNYRSTTVSSRSHPSLNQLKANVNELLTDPDNQLTNPADNTPKSLLIPLTLEEAFASPDAIHWHAAWKKEMTKVTDRKTYQLATVEEKQSMVTKALKSKFTFRLTCLIDGTWKYKVRRS